MGSVDILGDAGGMLSPLPAPLTGDTVWLAGVPFWLCFEFGLLGSLCPIYV